MKIFRLIPVVCVASLACSAAFAQTAPVPVRSADKATYQSNSPVVVVPPVVPPVVPTSASSPAPSMSTPAVAPIPTARTARDQGYTGGSDISLSPWEMETLRRLESPRQRGEKVDVAGRRNGVATDPANASWFQAWSQRLVSIGVHPDKIQFEGKRLTQPEFAMWASRQVWAVEAGLIAP